MAEMWSRVELITVERAKALLETNPRNRSIRKAKKRLLINDMMTGAFETTHQGIAIAEDGELVDGHHRLTAIVETGIPQRMLVTYNAPKSTKIDVGAMRSARDSLYMSGIIEKVNLEYNCLTSPLIKMIVRRSNGAEAAKLLSPMREHEIYLQLKKHINAVLICATAHKKGGKTKGSTVLYAMMCAEMAGVPMGVIDDWYTIATRGDFYVEGDDLMTRVGRSVLAYKNFIEQKGRSSASNKNEENEIIKKTMSSINHFYKRNPITKLYGEFVYPEVELTA